MRKRTKKPKNQRLSRALQDPKLIIRELNNRSFYHFLEFFWPVVSQEDFKANWHIPYICNELQVVIENLAEGKIKLHDIFINVPPGTTKTIICSIMFPVWCWTRWYYMKFITLSYSATLSLESAMYSRDIVKSDLFKEIYPDIVVKQDKDTKSNFRISKLEWKHGLSSPPRVYHGGNRYSTSIGGTLTGFHGHVIIVDDPVNPQQAVSEAQLRNSNQWISSTLPTRKVDKERTVTITIMQRLHQNDPTGVMIEKAKDNVKHICLPGEIKDFGHKVNPPELKQFYVDDLLDPVRLSWKALKDLEADLGQYGYAGQIGQDPTPPAGGMFKVDNFVRVDEMPTAGKIVQSVRYWDKAGTREQFLDSGKTARTCGVKMHKLTNGRWLISDVKKGRWDALMRERIIRSVAEADGSEVRIYHEQEPGSGGKESAEATTRNLAGFYSEADAPKGDKITRADPYSVQVNGGNIMLLTADWNADFIEEHRFFPYSKFKDQVDSGAGAFAKLSSKRMVKNLRRR